MVCLGLAVWIGSLSPVALASGYPAFIVTYAKLIEKRSPQKRFGLEHLEHKRRAPSVIPVIDPWSVTSEQQPGQDQNSSGLSGPISPSSSHPEAPPVPTAAHQRDQGV